MVVVTRGADGATAVTPDEIVHAPAGEAEAVADTVGAGDAFSAVLILGWMRSWPIDVTLARAADFAARVCTIRGATTTDRSLYRAAVESWSSRNA